MHLCAYIYLDALTFEYVYTYIYIYIYPHMKLSVLYDPNSHCRDLMQTQKIHLLTNKWHFVHQLQLNKPTNQPKKMVIKLLTIYNCLDYETELGNNPDMPLPVLILEIFCRLISFAFIYIYMKMSHHYLGEKKLTR